MTLFYRFFLTLTNLNNQKILVKLFSLGLGNVLVGGPDQQKFRPWQAGALLTSNLPDGVYE